MINELEIEVALDSYNIMSDLNEFKLSPNYSRHSSFINNHNLSSNNLAGAGLTFSIRIRYQSLI